MARGTFGERLKRERELREVPLDEITLATRIGPRFLEALENEDWEKLPGGVFNRGFVRSIARYLGLNEESFLAEYDLAHNAHAQLVEQKNAALKAENRIPQTPLWVPIVFVLALLLILAGLIYGGIFAWHRYVKHPSHASDSPIAPANTVTPSPFPTPAPPATSRADTQGVPADSEIPLDLSVSASALTQITIQADGATLFNGPFAPGENRHFSAKSEFVVTAGDSSAVLLELNGETMPPLGTPGASGTMTLSRKNLRSTPGGNSQP